MLKFRAFAGAGSESLRFRGGSLRRVRCHGPNGPHPQSGRAHGVPGTIAAPDRRNLNGAEGSPNGPTCRACYLHPTKGTTSRDHVDQIGSVISMCTPSTTDMLVRSADPEKVACHCVASIPSASTACHPHAGASWPAGLLVEERERYGAGIQARAKTCGRAPYNASSPTQAP